MDAVPTMIRVTESIVQRIWNGQAWRMIILPRLYFPRSKVTEIFETGPLDSRDIC